MAEKFDQEKEKLPYHVRLMREFTVFGGGTRVKTQWMRQRRPPARLIHPAWIGAKTGTTGEAA